MKEPIAIAAPHLRAFPSPNKRVLLDGHSQPPNKRPYIVKADPCLICYEPLSDGHIPVGHLDCSHCFHERCWAQWQATGILAGRDPTCPHCRAVQTQPIRSSMGSADEPCEETVHDLEGLSGVERARLLIREQLWIDNAEQVHAHLEYLSQVEISPQTLVEAGLIAAAVRCMTRFLHDKKVVAQGARMLSYLVTKCLRADKVLVLTNGAQQAIVAALGRYYMACHLSGRCCLLLSMALGQQSDWLESSVDEVVHYATLALVTCPTGKITDMQRAVMLLRAMGRVYSPERVLNAPWLIPAMVRVMRGDSEELVPEWCHLVMELAESRSFRYIFCKKKGFSALGEALGRFIDNPAASAAIRRALMRIIALDSEMIASE